MNKYDTNYLRLTSGEGMEKILALLVGEEQDISTVLIILSPALFFSLFILFSYEIDFRTILTAVLAFDIFSGLLSNVQAKTHQAWRRISKSYHKLFVAFHLTVYPLAVVLLGLSMPLTMMMLAMLVSKTAAFAIGNRLIRF
jgi:hypothetical protein